MATTYEKCKKENMKPTEVGLTSIEMKLLRLALDKAAYEGEADNAAIMFVRKLRERNATADELFRHSPATISEPSVSKCGDDGNKKMTFGKYKNEMIKEIPIGYLTWVLRNCTNIDPKLKLAIHNYLGKTQ